MERKLQIKLLPERRSRVTELILCKRTRPGDQSKIFNDLWQFVFKPRNARNRNMCSDFSKAIHNSIFPGELVCANNTCHRVNSKSNVSSMRSNSPLEHIFMPCSKSCQTILISLGPIFLFMLPARSHRHTIHLIGVGHFVLNIDLNCNIWKAGFLQFWSYFNVHPFHLSGSAVSYWYAKYLALFFSKVLHSVHLHWSQNCYPSTN